MKPVAIFRHFPIEGPGYFATFLDNNHIPWQLIKLDAGEMLPDNVHQFSGLVLMGGPMSVNDNLPWIEPELNLIRQAITNDIPVLGHCLGGQLMSKALGGAISRIPVKEIGWGNVTVSNSCISREWFDDLSEFSSFHWHGEAFTLPDGATRILSSRYCENQAFAMGIHLGMQCHVEMTEKMVQTWCQVNASELTDWVGPSVQSAEEMSAHLAEKIATLNKIATRLYAKWIAGLR
ncbi:GMP synthase-Glutamine amidotransferase [Nitrosomonas cryotolerans]|uniref:GMP synthase-Glutamine amidotransferase n=1 Tax=Nitrosomonas cryotolerans ATCC 49181 TaxID=1131553 RepID=A0A1N6G5Z8_9PROT|nr:type 1 glutamine amidotransferase [Nitrosomonas cryotolerans]SFP52004.1 GMP synthase-Glutamine amidotransferase [Nitrosomonas cryotolerans]SIO02965.1 GMP synthase-Glutamine amidotransferase [Nitrosomonas cryotolerans ATCC 49181]